MIDQPLSPHLVSAPHPVSVLALSFSPPRPCSYSGCEVRVTAQRTEVIIKATRTQNVLGEKGRRIRELTTAIQKRFKFEPGTIEVSESLSSSVSHDSFPRLFSLPAKAADFITVDSNTFFLRFLLPTSLVSSALR